MMVGELTVSNVRIAEMLGGVGVKPVGPYIRVRSRLGGFMYWEVDPKALTRQ